MLPDLLGHSPTREQIDRLGAVLVAQEAEQGVLLLDTWHTFAEGLVARTILIRAGTVLVGGAHKQPHLCVCHGDIEVTTDEGLRRLTGYHVVPALPGTKRVGLAHADTHWTTIHLNPTNERDVGKLEDAFIEDASQLQGQRTGIRFEPLEQLQ